MINTPVVIFTIGRDRYLSWRRRFTRLSTKRRKSWHVDDHFLVKMLLEEGSICIIHPNDEKPHKEAKFAEHVHYQHGNVKCLKSNTSVAFVFRVSPHSCTCDVHSNKVILDDKTLSRIKTREMKGEINDIERSKAYKQFDKEVYHSKLKQCFNTILSNN